MVRRKRSRKLSDSEDNVTDEEFALEELEEEKPPPKKYSLRTRNSNRNIRPVFKFEESEEDEEDDDDDADEEEVVHNRKESDDRDYEEDVDADEDDEDYDDDVDLASRTVRKSNLKKSKITKRPHTSPEPPSNIIIETKQLNPKYETDNGPANADGLIDFEDMIRADIVVIKGSKHLDYDHIIQQNSIKQQNTQEGRLKKRGTKSKVELIEPKVSEEEEQLNIFEPEVQTFEKDDNSLEIGYKMLQTKVQISETPPHSKETPLVIEASLDDIDKDPLALSVLPTPLVKPQLVSSVIDGVAPSPHEDDDDVIVLGELKTPVIVLDD